VRLRTEGSLGRKEDTSSMICGGVPVRQESTRTLIILRWGK
jgi:hypothetical protein